MIPATAFGEHEAQLVPAAVRGFRTWYVLDDGAPAASAFPYRWERELVAECLANGAKLHPTQDAPVAWHTCGIYAYYQPCAGLGYPAPVFGAIEATGRVVLGARGFRTERARILGLAPYPGASGPAVAAARAWADREGVPWYATAALLAGALPADDVDELVGMPVPREPLTALHLPVFPKGVFPLGHPRAGLPGSHAKPREPRLKRLFDLAVTLLVAGFSADLSYERRWWEGLAYAGSIIVLGTGFGWLLAWRRRRVA